MRRLLSLAFVIILAATCCSSTLAYATVSSELLIPSKEFVTEQATPRATTWKDKITDRLWEKMASLADDELIPVWLFKEDIPDETIDQMLLDEKGFDASIYDDPVRFESEIVPVLTERIERRAGYERAHKARPLNELYRGEIVDKYVMSRRDIARREFSKLNNAFIEKHIGTKSREVIYNSRYTSTLVVEATKSEIEKFAKLDEVVDVSLYVDYVLKSGLHTVLSQTGIGGASGTKGSNFNGGAGYKGTNVKIGIMEATEHGTVGRFDATCPQLAGVPLNRLIFANNAGPGGTAIPAQVGDHATMVTSLIVGQSVTVGGNTYEGVVPLATVYQTPVNTSQHMINAISNLAGVGCKVINFSGGFRTNGSYHREWDLEVDKLIVQHNISLVVAAGNIEGWATNYVYSPGFALNAITAGNAATKQTATLPYLPPYSMHESSCYNQWSSPIFPMCLPNKPDIAAPGMFISYVRRAGTIQTAHGTSLSTPLVTGVVAQMMQKSPILQAEPTFLKEMLLLGANFNAISATNSDGSSNDLAACSYLRDRSGAGLLNAIGAVNAVDWNYQTGFKFSNLNPITKSIGTVAAGKRIRVVMVFDKRRVGTSDNITSPSHLDDIDLFLTNSSGTTVSFSNSARNNVEILEYTVPADPVPPVVEIEKA